ncbi:MAG: hypothetical protein HQL30_02930 [Candidatus Omnitrophica bacterium]|nr:hypothetical protein [Candidatus Omnitrophota bacterium]
MTIYKILEIAGGETGLKIHLPYTFCQKLKWLFLVHYYSNQSLRETDKG